VVRVNDFSIEYREDGSEKQFFSDLSVLDASTGEQLTRKTISVNKPLRWGGVTMYQTDWSLAALSLRAEGSPMQPADGNSFNLPMASLEGNPGQSSLHDCASLTSTLLNRWAPAVACETIFCLRACMPRSITSTAIPPCRRHQWTRVGHIPTLRSASS